MKKERERETKVGEEIKLSIRNFLSSFFLLLCPMGLKGEFQTQSGCDFSVYSLSFKNPGSTLTFPQDIHSRFLQKIDTMIVVDISIQMKFYINFLIIISKIMPISLYYNMPANPI